MTEGLTRFRSPPSPYVSLAKAVERAELLYARARHFAVPMTTAADAWNLKITSSATLQTAAALIQYGLLEDEGSNSSRRVKLSKLGMDIVMDKRPASVERRELTKKAALNPIIFGEIWRAFGDAKGLDDSILLHSLTFERSKANKAPFSLESAKEAVRVYRESISFAGLHSDQDELEEPITPPPTVNVGDLVQWLSDGVLALPEPARVRFISPDKQWVFVDGSETGLPVRQVEVLVPVAAQEAVSPSNLNRTPIFSPKPPRLPQEDDADGASVQVDDIKLTIGGGRVIITASVDLAGLKRLQKKLIGVAALLSDDDE